MGRSTVGGSSSTVGGSRSTLGGSNRIGRSRSTVGGSNRMGGSSSTAAGRWWRKAGHQDISVGVGLRLTYFPSSQNE